jgi:allantoinase
MNRFDLILRDGTLVTHEGARHADIGIADGIIAAIEPAINGAVRGEINAAGLHIFPGLIDAHVHFNEPGRADWEGFETGSHALAAGGATMFFDMPLNSQPPTIDAESFSAKLALARTKSMVDFALWGGLVPGNLDRLEELRDCGAIGFKAFMADSGVEEFPRVDDATLREGMKRAAKLKLPVAVHAENQATISKLTQERLAQNKISIRDFLESRPVAAELEAIRRALELAGETGCAIHIVHVSCGAGVELVAEARARGVDASCETCPHYLVGTGEDMEKIGAPAKCAPPLRGPEENNQLWSALSAGKVTTIGSDHSPAPPAMKSDGNFFKIWGGISGGQHTLTLLLSGYTGPGGIRRGIPLPSVVRMTSYNVAARFNLPRTKGRAEVGSHADFALVNLQQIFEIKREELLDRHGLSPYVGRRVRGKVERTIVRGQTVFKDGKIVAKRLGQLVAPNQ